MSGATDAASTGAVRGGRRLALLLAGPLLLAGVGAWAWFAGGRYVTTDNAYLKADVVGIASRVAGQVTTVSARTNGRVAAGDPLFSIDRAPLEVALAHAEAALSAARAEVAGQRATLARRRAELSAARVALAQAEREASRLEPLVARGIASRVTYDRATYEARAANEQRVTAERAVAEAEAALGSAQSGATDGHPRVRLAAADVARARLDLAYAETRATVPGTLATVTLHAGEYVEAGKAVLHLVASDRPWIEANLKETQLEHLVPGQSAEVRIDAYPGVVWRARVDSLGPASGAEFALLPPDNASGNWVKIVQRVPIRLEFDTGNPPLPLRAGTSVEVRIDTGERNVRWRRLFGAGA
jgi:membrane fusion protein (multidrug efflux system)